MRKKLLRSFVFMFIILFAAVQIASAAQPAQAAATLQNIRFSQSAEKVRIVLDLDSLPQYKAVLEQQPLRIVVDFPGTLGNKVNPQTAFNDEIVSGVHVSQLEKDKVRAVVDLRKDTVYKVFTLPQPNRLVIDIIKKFDHQVQRDIAPGLKYTEWYRSSQAGPITAYILDVDPKAGYQIKPLLSNETIAKLESVTAMSDRAQAIAAVNGSYFAPNGQILGLLKMDGQIVSTPEFARTAMGVMPDGSIVIDMVDYKGSVTLPDGRLVAIGGVNCERGSDELVLYNDFFNSSTQTNEYGVEYVITDDKITAIGTSDTPIAQGTVVLSAHGMVAASMANLKVGDKVKIRQTLGPVWDKTVSALGAGPTLIKNGNVYVTTKLEQFGSDVAGGRAPRTALGVTKEGRVLLVVVDGRQTHSIGMSLLELAQFMRELGAVNAMNLDGGGSSEIVLGGSVINKPSDGRERYVGDALAIFQKQTI